MKRRLATATAAFAVLLATTPAQAADSALINDPPRPIEDFELTDHNDESLRFSSLRGRPTFVFFGFTRCPDVCPLALQKLNVLLRAHGAELGNPRVVLISVDPEHDSPPALKAALKPYTADFIGLTGEKIRLREVAARFSAVAFPALTKDAMGRYLIDHSGQIYLVDEEGRLRATFFNPPQEALERVSKQLLHR